MFSTLGSDSIQPGMWPTTNGTKSSTKYLSPRCQSNIYWSRHCDASLNGCTTSSLVGTLQSGSSQGLWMPEGTPSICDIHGHVNSMSNGGEIRREISPQDNIICPEAMPISGEWPLISSAWRPPLWTLDSETDSNSRPLSISHMPTMMLHEPNPLPPSSVEDYFSDSSSPVRKHGFKTEAGLTATSFQRPTWMTSVAVGTTIQPRAMNLLSPEEESLSEFEMRTLYWKQEQEQEQDSDMAMDDIIYSQRHRSELNSSQLLISGLPTLHPDMDLAVVGWPVTQLASYGASPRWTGTDDDMQNSNDWDTINDSSEVELQDPSDDKEDFAKFLKTITRSTPISPESSPRPLSLHIIDDGRRSPLFSSINTPHNHTLHTQVSPPQLCHIWQSSKVNEKEDGGSTPNWLSSLVAPGQSSATTARMTEDMEDERSGRQQQSPEKIIAHRSDSRDAFLLECKQKGMSYREIKKIGHFEEAESTLRGRFRTLTKRKEQRVRKPQWQAKDVSLNPLSVLCIRRKERLGKKKTKGPNISIRRKP